MGERQRTFLRALAGSRRVAIDTNACIYYLQRSSVHFDLVHEVLRRAVSGALPVEIPGVVRLELLVRPYQTGDMGLMRTIRRLTEEMPGIDVTDISTDVIFASAAVRAHTRLKLPDALVAGAAAVSGCDLVIGNDRKFRRVNDVGAVALMSETRMLRLPRYVHLDDYVEDA